jgi:hypothetical protein
VVGHTPTAAPAEEALQVVDITIGDGAEAAHGSECTMKYVCAPLFRHCVFACSGCLFVFIPFRAPVYEHTAH